MTLMTVDDSATMRKIVIVELKDLGYTIVEAENGKDALNKLNNQHVDFFVIDINMPEMNGIEFLKALRSRPEYQSAPAIMLTTESEKSLVEQAKAAGANAWVLKPFKNEELLNLVKKLQAA